MLQWWAGVGLIEDRRSRYGGQPWHYGTKPGRLETSNLTLSLERGSERREQNERSGGRERSEQSEASERVSGASERASGRESGPVLTSLFFFVPDHSAMVEGDTRV